MSGEPARVLVVCTGNVCRSPLAEALLRARLADAGIGPDQVLVESAGVRALVGASMTAEAASELAGVGVAPGSDPVFRSRQLAADAVRSADLVLTAQRHHRSAVVQLAPAAVRRTYTVRELARLLDGADLSDLPADPADRLRALPAVANRRKGLGGPVPTEDDDVRDPYGGTGADYAATTAQIVPAVQALVAALTCAGHGTRR